jgi:CubicO group peptidase (beta-lactamase class C family)
MVAVPGTSFQYDSGGLELRPRDVAKLGQLYLDGGRWGDEPVVPAEWVRESTRIHVERSYRHNIGYGYLWWIHEPDRGGAGAQTVWAAQGFRGQYVFVVPEHDMVVVVTGGTTNWDDEIRPIDRLYDEILPSVVAASP